MTLGRLALAVGILVDAVIVNPSDSLADGAAVRLRTKPAGEVQP